MRTAPRSSQIYPYISYGRPRLVPSSEVATTGSIAAETAARIAADNTLQANINLKANIASPTFTGDPKAPTPATADNDTSVATTAFVKAQNYVVYPTWTVGSISFATSTTSLGQDNANLFWDNTAKRLGIGLATALTVGGASNQGLQLAGTGGPARFTMLRADASATPPAVFLGKSRGTLTTPGAVAVNDGLGQIRFCGDDGTSVSGSGQGMSAGIMAEVDAAVSTGNVPGRLVFSTAAGGALVERVRIDSAGNVGIGTTTSGGNLMVRRDSSNVGFGNVTLRLTNQDATASNNNWLDFADTSTGNSSAAIGGQFDDRVNHYGTIFLATRGTDGFIKRVTVSSDGGVIVGAPTGGSHGIGTLSAVTVYGNNVVLTSDARLKQDIEPLPECLGLVGAIVPKVYRWKPLDDRDGVPDDFAERRHRGFLAQEVAAHLGGDDDSVDLGGLVAVLWKAVQELSAEVKELRGG